MKAVECRQTPGALGCCSSADFDVFLIQKLTCTWKNAYTERFILLDLDICILFCSRKLNNALKKYYHCLRNNKEDG